MIRLQCQAGRCGGIVDIALVAAPPNLPIENLSCPLCGSGPDLVAYTVVVDGKPRMLSVQLALQLLKET